MITTPSRLRGFVMCCALAASTGAAYGQPAPLPWSTPLPASPSSSMLPDVSGNTRLPGPDPRECGTSRFAALCAAGRWLNFSRIELHVTVGSFAADYVMEQPEGGEVYATYSEGTGAARRGGETVIISDDAFAYRTRDKFAANNEVLDHMMTAPLMFAQLAAVLFESGVPGGTNDIVATQAINTGSTTQFIRTQAPSAAALYGPPWHVTGTIRRLSPTQFAFHLQLAFRPVDAQGKLIATRRETAELSGTVTYATERKMLSASFDLVGWKLVKGNADMPPVETLGQARESVGKR